MGIESSQSKDVAPTSNSNMQVKGGHFKHKMRKRHGYVFAGFFYIILLRSGLQVSLTVGWTIINSIRSG